MPGMLTDVVREIREAARIREEALIQRFDYSYLDLILFIDLQPCNRISILE